MNVTKDVVPLAMHLGFLCLVVGRGCLIIAIVTYAFRRK